jgi:AraC family transcriptional regulator, melibiose operon regulatory protein
LLRPQNKFLQNGVERFRNPSRDPLPVYHHLDDCEGRADIEREDQLRREGVYVEQHVATAMPVAHWHADIELNILLGGEMTYLINGRQVRVGAGQFALFWAAIPHRTIAVAPDTPLVCIFLPLMDFLALPMPRGARQSVMRGDFICDPRSAAIDIALAQRWVAEWPSPDTIRRRLIEDEIRLRVRRLLLEWRPHVAEGPAADSAGRAGKSGPIGRCEILTDLINAHYAQPLGVEHLAEMAGMHPSTANKSFRQVLGLSVNDYIIRYRLAQAMQRLADTDEPIVQVAFGCGFQSQSQFYELFRHRVGTTPGKFRAGHKSGNADGEPEPALLRG